MNNKKVCVIGLGYIGLPTSALLALKGYSVLGVDINSRAVELINQGKIHIVEPELDVCVHDAVKRNRLKASVTIDDKVDIFIICVPTPLARGEGVPGPDLSYVWHAVDAIASHLKHGNLVILESTSPVGTTERIKERLLQKHGVKVEGLYFAHCPERVLPGHVMRELIENDRIVGGVDEASTQIAGDFYASFVEGTVLRTDAKTAEMCKLVENSFRDVNIAFANELSLLCDKQGVDVWKLIQLANRHPRVNILSPGPGVGGHCLAVDPWFLVAEDPENARLIRSAREVNERKTKWVIQKVKQEAQRLQRASDKICVACLGLAFKPDIDDLRESPALEIAESLKEEGYNVLAVEPNIQAHARLELSSLESALSRADIFLGLVKHRNFLMESSVGRFKEKIFLDFCGFFRE